MNIRLILRLLGTILLVEAGCMLPALGLGLAYGDGDAAGLLLGLVITAAFALPMRFLSRPKEKDLHPRDGFFVVGFAWILLSVFGALPLLLTGMFKTFPDAFFEAASGFTTTGATVLTDFNHMMHGVTLWRSFTHWIGGMGVLIFALALLPRITGHSNHLAKAESPGPSLSKIVPKLGETAKIQYLIYFALTFAEWLVLMIAGMGPYDAVIHAVGTAGTGGFSNYGASIAAFQSPLIEWIITVFMILFAINFALYYRVIHGGWRDALKSEELHWFLGALAVAITVISILIRPIYHNLGDTVRNASFQVASLVSTTGFSTADHNLWPEAAKMVLLILMIIGGCAGSTAGGIKVVRFGILVKLAKRSIAQAFEPRKVKVVRFEHKGIEESMLHAIAVYACVYFILILIGTLVLSFDPSYTLLEHFTASLTCVNNVGPGLGAVGPAGNFSGYSAFSKLFMSFLMLAGRLELYPILILLHVEMYKR